MIVRSAGLRAADSAETSQLVAIAVATGLFSPEDADLLLRQTLDDLHGGRLGDDHVALVITESDTRSPAGWAYFSRNEKSNGVWDLWWIGIAPARHRAGLGTQLLEAVEHHVREAGGRMLVIETSSLDALARTREFYRRRGYRECGCVPDFYGDGDGKVTFARLLVRPQVLVDD